MSAYLMPGSIISLTREAATLLIRLDCGDAALLYIHMLCGEAPESLPWSHDRLQDALTVLQNNSLVPASIRLPDPAPVVKQTLPEYPREVIRDALADPTSQFSALCDEVGRQLERHLAPADIQELYRMYDYLNLPPEVIFTVVSWCSEDTEYRKGPGHRPGLPHIRRTAAAWAKQGVTTIEQADEHLRRLTRLRSREIEIMQLLDQKPRPLIPAEQTYVAAWDDMGFDNDAIRLAFDRCSAVKHELNWNYMNGILRRWHLKNLHTVVDIEANDRSLALQSGFSGTASTPAGTQESSAWATRPEDADEQTKADMEQVRYLLEQMERGEA